MIVFSIAFSHDGNCVALGTDDGERIGEGTSGGVVEIWDTFSGNLIRTLTGHNRSVTSVAYLTGSQQITSGSRDGAVRVWDVDSGNLIRQFETGDEVLSIASLENRQLVASGYHPTRLWDSASGHCIQTIQTPYFLDKATFSSDGQHFLTANSTIYVWDLTSGNLVRDFDCARLTSFALSTDNRRIASGSRDGTIQHGMRLQATAHKDSKLRIQ